ncbi:MAG: cytochrome c3 family protein [Smithella sp.]
MASGGLSPHRHRWTKILCWMGILLFILAVSSAGWSQKTPETGALLGDRHKAAGVGCVQCHKDKPSAPVNTAVCSGCHPNVAKGETIREKLPNPHNAHMEYPACAECHHVHKPSDNQCAGCHSFNFRMR